MRFVGKYGLALLVGMLSLVSCQQDYQSNVPDYPVRFDMDIQSYILLSPRYDPHFTLDGGFQTRVYTEKITINEYLGYSGLLIWVDVMPQYRAADLCCPHCLKRDVPVHVDGIYAVCPLCGEQYDLINMAFPTKGISDQPLRHYDVSYKDGRLSVRH